MSVILLILGILVTGAGIVSIGFGIPINEFNLGNTMIVAGSTAAAGGLVLIGLAAAVEQLTQIAKALRPRAGSRPVMQSQPAEPAGPGVVRPGQFPIQAPAQAPVQAPMQAPPQPSGQVRPPVPAPPRGPLFARPRAEELAGEPAPAQPTPEVPFSAIERLRSSLAPTDRKAGELADAAETEDGPYNPVASAPAVSARPSPAANVASNPVTNGAAPPTAAGAGEAPRKPPLDFLFRSKPRAPQPDPFDAVWPKRGPRREEERPDAAEAAKPAAEPPIGRPSRPEMPPASAPDDLRPAAILKSGVVDGMAYTLYADGSIEAQLPQGTVRFGSIAELRSHIENSS